MPCWSDKGVEKRTCVGELFAGEIRGTVVAAVSGHRDFVNRFSVIFWWAAGFVVIYLNNSGEFGKIWVESVLGVWSRVSRSARWSIIV
jgi:hypothetical protein